MKSDTMTASGAESLRDAFLQTLHCGLGRPLEVASKQDIYQALALVVGERSIRDDCRDIWRIEPAAS